MSTSARKKAQRQAEHQKLKKQKELEKKFGPKATKKKKEFIEYKPKEITHRETQYYPSFKSSTCTAHATAKAESKRYTGTLVKGIATMHKSNAVPVISQQEAEDISKMRRG
jgi:Na+-translocating ferredoxin:NAD+ oxidoreductase RnfG subunit